MSFTEIHKRIGHAESALKDAGPDQALNAIIDTLKEIARTVEALEKPSSPKLPQ
jgi:hypothetical protein